ncbi:MAG: hypothetical protein Q6365_023750 [Candidatus Sigynarchaeota archaeon]
MARGNVSMSREGLKWTRSSCQEHLEFTPDLFFMFRISTKSSTIYEWTALDTLVFWSLQKRRLKVNVGPFADFPKVFNALIKCYRAWLADRGLMIDMKTAAAEQVARDPFVGKIIEKLRCDHVKPMEEKDRPFHGMLVSGSRVNPKEFPRSSRSRYSSLIYDIYNEPGEKIGYFYRPKHALEAFFSPGMITYFLICALTIISWVAPKILEGLFAGLFPSSVPIISFFSSFIGPLIFTLIAVMLSCMFLPNKISSIYYMTRLELGFSDRKMLVVTSEQKIMIVPRANFSAVTFKKSPLKRNRYDYVQIHFKVPVKNSPFLVKNLFFLYNVDADDPVLSLIDEFVKGNQL